MTLIIASPATLPFGETLCPEQAERFALASPTNAYLMSVVPMVPCVCHPQYCVRKPLVSLTSALVRTRYTPLASEGNLPDEMAPETTARTPASDNAVPCE